MVLDACVPAVGAGALEHFIIPSINQNKILKFKI